MIVVDNIKQGSEEWMKLRVGIPTSSCFDKIITPTGKSSTQSKAYLHTLLAEWLTGTKTSIKQSDAMIRGIALEAEARSTYEFIEGVKVSEVGLIYKDEKKLVSCSPDGILSQSGLEIKAPNPGTHVGYMLNGDIPLKYIPQIQGSMWVTGFDYWIFMSYHPDMPPFIIRVDRDERYIKIIEELVYDFIDKMLIKRQQLEQYND